MSSVVATGDRRPPTDLSVSSLLLLPAPLSLHPPPPSPETSSTKSTSSIPTTSQSRGTANPAPSTTASVTPSANRRSSASLPRCRRTTGIPKSSSRNLLSLHHKRRRYLAIFRRFRSLTPRRRLSTLSRCRSGRSSNRRR